MGTDEQALSLDVLSDLTTPWAIRVAATLNVADHIDDGATDLDDLAQRTGAHADALARMLRHLVHFGVFVETGPGVFGLTEKSRELCSTAQSRRRAWLDITGAGGRIDEIYHRMLDAVRYGEPVYESVHGLPFWQEMATDPEIAESFDSLMARHAPLFTEIVTAYSWPENGHVVDLGGGAGALVAEILRNSPGTRGTVVDLPGTVDGARKVLSAAGVAERAHIVAGSFFGELPDHGDIYVLAHVLHNWNADAVTTILSRAAEAAGTDGKVLIVEQLVDPDDDPAAWATRLDLKMLMLMGGRERTLDQIEELAREAGLSSEVVRTTESNLTLIECRALASGPRTSPESSDAR